MRARLAIVIMAATGAFILTGCDMAPTSAPPPFVGTPYPKSGVAMWRGNAQHAGVYDTEPVRKLNGTRWKSSGMDGMPVVANGILYFNSSSAIEAVSAETGKKVWEFAQEYVSFTAENPGIAIMKDTLYGSRSHTVFAIDTATHQEKWRFAEEKGGALTSPVVTENAIYFGASFDKGSALYALDRSTGKVIWRSEDEKRLGDYAGPVTAGGMVYFAEDVSEEENPTQGYVRALDGMSGKERWKFEEPSIGVGIRHIYLAVADGSLYIRDAERVISVDATSGEEQWRNDSSVYLPTAPAISGGIIYVTHGSVLEALDAKTGQAKWEYTAKLHQAYTSNAQTSPVVAGDVIYFGVEQFGNRGSGPGSESALYAVDAGTGQELWTFNLGRSLNHGYQPVVADGVVYVRTDDSNLTLHALH